MASSRAEPFFRRSESLTRAKPKGISLILTLASKLNRTQMNQSSLSTLFNGHSMVGALDRVLVCSPRTAGWNQPERTQLWKALGFHHAPDFATAQSQHEALC